MPDDPRIRYLGDVQRLVLNDGDIVVLSVPERISMDSAQRLKAMLQDTLGLGRKVLVIDSGSKIGVLGKE